jgi:hypothetical protein
MAVHELWANAEPLTGGYEVYLQSEEKRAAARQTEQGAQTTVLRCVFGNPYQKPALSSHWLTPTVVALASGIYADYAFERLPILADAVEDAGCYSAELLRHLRDGGPHVRGCWALDLLLGKD